MVLTSITLWTILLLVVALLYYVRRVEPNRLKTEAVPVPVSGLPAELRGLKIAHLSDMHLRESEQSISISRQAVAEIMTRQPDLICITGDVAHRSECVDLACKVLSPLAAEHGAYAVLGNHDMDQSLELTWFCEKTREIAPAEWVTRMAAIGVDLLLNEHRCLRVRGRLVVIVGIGDPSCGYDDLEKALSGAPRGDLNILLSHSPDIFDNPRVEWANLVLCGHTHGGQVQLPGIGAPWAPVWRGRRRAAGLMRVGERTVAYVSRGIGSGTLARLNCPPEVTMLTMDAGDAANMKMVR